jgi:hypothetical protein
MAIGSSEKILNPILDRIIQKSIVHDQEDIDGSNAGEIVHR